MNLYIDMYAQRDKTIKYIHAYLHFPVTVRNQERKKTKVLVKKMK